MKTLWVLLTITFLLVLPGGALAEESIRSEDNLDRVREQIETTRHTYTALQAVRDALQNQLADIEKRYGDLARSIHRLEVNTRERDGRITQLKRRQADLQASIQQQQAILGEQLKAAQFIGRHDWLKLLMNQEDPSSHARVLAYYVYLAQARSELVGRLSADIVRIRETADDLSRESAKQTSDRKQLANERVALSDAVRARKALLFGWNQELKDQSETLGRLRDDERRLQSLIRSVEKKQPETDDSQTDSSGAEGQPSVGRCPPEGVIRASFGDSRAGGRWDGVLIGGREGAPVRAAVSGKVVFADWLRGYGLLIIVDHGDGVMSLYAFNQTLHKHVGDKVVQGELIAAIGASGGRSNPGLYFGIREQGHAVDPLAWCNTAH